MTLDLFNSIRPRQAGACTGLVPNPRSGLAAVGRLNVTSEIVVFGRIHFVLGDNVAHTAGKLRTGSNILEMTVRIHAQQARKPANEV